MNILLYEQFSHEVYWEQTLVPFESSCVCKKIYFVKDWRQNIIVQCCGSHFRSSSIKSHQCTEFVVSHSDLQISISTLLSHLLSSRPRPLHINHSAIYWCFLFRCETVLSNLNLSGWPDSNYSVQQNLFSPDPEFRMWHIPQARDISIISIWSYINHTSSIINWVDGSLHT